MRKKLLVTLLAIVTAWCTIAYAEPTWMSSDTIATLESIPGFTFEYDEMDDTISVFPSNSITDYLAGDGMIAPKVEGMSGVSMFSLLLASDSKFNEAITGVIILVDGVRYEYKPDASTLSPGMCTLPIGNTGADMTRAMITSEGEVKIRLQHNSGNVDFVLNDIQRQTITALFEAYESIGGFKQDIITSIDRTFPLTVR